MNWLSGSLKELWGLFVEDGSYALAILGWIGLVSGLIHFRIVPASWLGPMLFTGLALILLENIIRSKRRL